MTLPALIFAFLIATLYGLVFHLLRGGRAGRLVLYTVLSWIGFTAGQLLAEWMGWTLGSIGPVHFFFASMGSLAFIGIGYWLSLVETKEAEEPYRRSGGTRHR
ncbi:MAG: hypothetical protein AB1894_03380 [Chloroflexota bacterium]